ncbi:replication factor C small subunit [Yasminevirus sp. GU-2018]|uniref:Replication factor C small subunit n=1 Tax=Yasminevirus sp. GU-2018 TaxID=2420051 RepID=A0A5K0U9U9_9VIRU|nr:replication factor C small subunit [Yasminevirus sp. GU-2018]
MSTKTKGKTRNVDKSDIKIGRRASKDEIVVNSDDEDEFIHEKPDIDVDNLFKDEGMIVVNKGRITDKTKIIRDKRNTTWVDKYRPKTLKDIVGHDDVKNMLITSIKKGDLPHLLFHGGSGTGKTSTVLALVMQLYGPNRVHEKVLELNASDENGINVVRDKIIKFSSVVVGSSDPGYPSPPFKIVILDEADSMTSEAQTALKKVMEKTCDITRFVFICNYESKIIDAIKSRCADFRFSPIPDDLMIEKLKTIAKDENMNVSDDVFHIITELCEGDARRSINTLQNLKYIPRKVTDPITKEDVYKITSYVDKTYLTPFWKKITTGEISELHDVVVDITNLGYPMNYVMRCVKDKVMESNLSQKDISNLVIHIGKVERMVTSGSDNWIQLLAILTHVNAVSRGIEVLKPRIY